MTVVREAQASVNATQHMVWNDEVTAATTHFPNALVLARPVLAPSQSANSDMPDHQVGKWGGRICRTGRWNPAVRRKYQLQMLIRSVCRSDRLRSLVPSRWSGTSSNQISSAIDAIDDLPTDPALRSRCGHARSTSA